MTVKDIRTLIAVNQVEIPTNLELIGCLTRCIQYHISYLSGKYDLITNLNVIYGIIFNMAIHSVYISFKIIFSTWK